MKRWLTAIYVAVFSLVLAGCATTSTVRSEVTAFHEWPADVQDKSYVFERAADQENNLEYRNYEQLVRAELQRLGFTEAPGARSARLRVSIGYDMNVRDVRVSEPVVVDPYWPGPYWHRPYWGHPYWRGYYSPFYSPFYDPFWYGPPAVGRRESNFQVYTRRLNLTFTRASDGKRVHQTTVVSEGTNGSLAAVMPYMIRSAFTDFPGQSGVPRRIELQMEKAEK